MGLSFFGALAATITQVFHGALNWPTWPTDDSKGRWLRLREAVDSLIFYYFPIKGSENRKNAANPAFCE
jgi:hypothetical protein